ncbi:MAG TPA: ABC transporter permease [Planctomycetota bacterium]|nr:ABC transporter permease [Planctomycetota bacterium]
MTVPFAWRNLTQNRARTLVAAAGMSFTIVLAFVQMGFHAALMRAATSLQDRLDFDVILVSPEYVYTRSPGTIPFARVKQAPSVEGVASAVPFYAKLGHWRHPESGMRREVMVLGFRPEDAPFLLPELRQSAPLLAVPDTILVDRVTRPDYGPHPDGMVGELDWRRVTVAGHYTLGLGFVVYGCVATSDETWSRVTGISLDRATFGLVKVAPGADPARVARRLEAALPGDVRVLTRAALEAHERDYWSTSSSFGLIFGSGVLVALLTTAIISYQVLATDIANRVREYATLKALGYRPGSVSLVVLRQGAILAAAAWLASVPVATVLGDLTGRATQLPVAMTVPRALVVLVWTLAIAAIAGFVATRKLRAADPAELFG